VEITFTYILLVLIPSNQTSRLHPHGFVTGALSTKNAQSRDCLFTPYLATLLVSGLPPIR